MSGRSPAQFLSPQQERLWLLQKTQPCAAFQACCNVRIQGTVRGDLLKHVLIEVAGCHDILRTKYASEAGGNLRQTVEDVSSIAFSMQQANDIPAIASRESAPLIELQEAPIMRVSLIKESEQSYLLSFSLPAFYADADSLSRLVSEVASCYNTRSCGDNWQSKTAWQYADFAAWQREVLQAEDTLAGRQFWGRQDFSALLSQRLPFEHLAVLGSEFQPEVVQFKCDDGVISALLRLAENSKVSLRSIFLATWCEILQRFTGQEKIVVASSSSGRPYPELQGGFGLYARYLPLSISLAGSHDFMQTVARTQEVLTQAEKRQNYFDWKQMVLNFPGLAPADYFPFCFDFHELPAPASGAACFSLNRLSVCFDQFKIRLACTRHEYGTELQWDFNPTCLTRDSVLCIADTYMEMLRNAAHGPAIAMDKLQCLSEGQRRRVLFEFNRTAAECLDLCVSQLFEEQVQFTPDNLAVISADTELTYAELNRQANRLAHHLKRVGAGPEQIVAVYLERSPELMIAMLGILKAGSAFVLLETASPPDRVSFMIADTQARILLTSAALRDQLRTPESLATIVLPQFLSGMTGQDDFNPKPAASPGNLAYVIYTSGSTGRPKGVLIDNGSIALHAQYVRKCYDIVPSDRAVQFAPVNFDAALEQIFATLISGAALVLRDPELWLPDMFLTKLRELGVTIINPPAAYWRQIAKELAQTSQGESQHHLKVVMIGGDAMFPEDVRLWRKASIPTDRLMHCYGPTETTVYVTNIEVPAKIEGTAMERRIPIGKPTDRRRVYVLDQYGNPVPIGVTGEIYIGGQGLARGYLKCPDQTAEKFVPDPFSERPGCRLYRTGDLGRYLEDGNIEFLGRMDYQV